MITSLEIVRPAPSVKGGGGLVAGPSGLSAYQIAAVHGFAGSEGEWVESLRGATGPANALGIGSVDTGAPGSSAAASITGVAPGQFLHLVLPRGAAGPPNAILIGTVTTVSPTTPANATLTGVSPSQTLNLWVPAGRDGSSAAIKGTVSTASSGTLPSTGQTLGDAYVALDTGHLWVYTGTGTINGFTDVGQFEGPPGPANALSIGTVTSGGSPSATLTGSAPAQTLNLVLQRGDAGPPNSLTVGSVTTGPAGGPAAAAITGAAPSQTLNLTIPQGVPGGPGSPGIGVPAGGLSPQALRKKTGSDYDTEWFWIPTTDVTIEQFGGGTGKTAAQNTAALKAAFDLAGSSSSVTVRLRNDAADYQFKYITVPDRCHLVGAHGRSEQTSLTAAPLSSVYPGTQFLRLDLSTEITANLTTTATSNTATVSSTFGLEVGMPVRMAPQITAFIGSISGTTLTVAAMQFPEAIMPGMVLFGLAATAGTTVVNQISGATGGVGTYTVSISQTVSVAEYMFGLSPILSGTYITNISGTTLTLSRPALATVSSAQMRFGGTVSLGNAASLRSVYVAPSGMSFPVSGEGAFAALSQGIGLGGAGCGLENVLCMGFDRCLVAVQAGRALVKHFNFDGHHGILVDSSYDTSVYDHLHGWPFASINGSASNPNNQRSGHGLVVINANDNTVIPLASVMYYLINYLFCTQNVQCGILYEEHSTGDFRGNIGLHFAFQRCNFVTIDQYISAGTAVPIAYDAGPGNLNLISEIQVESPTNHGSEVFSGNFIFDRFICFGLNPTYSCIAIEVAGCNVAGLLLDYTSGATSSQFPVQFLATGISEDSVRRLEVFAPFRPDGSAKFNTGLVLPVINASGTGALALPFGTGDTFQVNCAGANFISSLSGLWEGRVLTLVFSASNAGNTQLFNSTGLGGLRLSPYGPSAGGTLTNNPAMTPGSTMVLRGNSITGRWDEISRQIL